jgi:hypothetical protein
MGQQLPRNLRLSGKRVALPGSPGKKDPPGTGAFGPTTDDLLLCNHPSPVGHSESQLHTPWNGDAHRSVTCLNNAKTLPGVQEGSRSGQ